MYEYLVVVAYDKIRNVKSCVNLISKTELTRDMIKSAYPTVSNIYLMRRP